MKTIFLIFTILVALATLKANAGLPPTNLSGQSQSVRPTTFVFKTPARQATQTSGIESLIETGNTNLLANPSYEHQTTASGWTSSVTSTAVATYGTAATSSGELGLRQATFSCAGGASGGVCTFFQDVTTSKIIQGLALMYVSTTNASATKFITRANGTKNQEIIFQATTEALYKLAVILGSTSTGLGVEITAGVGVTITGTMDAAALGAQDIKQDVDQSRIAGESYFTGTASCTWARTSATIGAFGTVAACPGPTIVDGSMGTWLTTDSDLPRQTINNLPAGKYKATFQFPAILSSSSGSVITITDGTTTCNAVRSTDTATYTGQMFSCIFSYTSSGSRVFELHVASGAGTFTVANNSTAPAASVKFNLEYFGSGQVYSSSCGANCEDSFSAYVSGTVLSKQNTSWSSAVVSVTDTSLHTITINTGVFSISPNCNVTGENNDSTISNNVRIVSISNTSIVVRTGFSTTASSFTKALTPFYISCSKNGADFVASRTIIGTFNEVMTVPGVTKPKTCYYAFGGAAATLASPVVCSTGTCVEVYDSCGTATPPTFGSTGIYNNLTFASGTFANNSFIECKANAFSTSVITLEGNMYFDTGDNSWAASATGGAVLNLASVNVAGAVTNAYHVVSCKGVAP